MNTRQAWYQANRIFSGNGDLSYSAMAAFMGYRIIQTMAVGAINPPAAAMQIILFAYAGRLGYYGLKSRLRLNEKKKELDSHPNEYYFADSEEIVISHKEGLEMLLEKTADKKWREWGTFLNAHEEGTKAVIHNILQPEKAEAMGLITKKRLTGILPKVIKAGEMGFDGLHHFHPFGGTSNYSVSTLDRNLPMGWINLLTFNTNGNPEIIAYNNRHVYIPKDKSGTLEAKSVLVKATPKDIMKYLAK
jgi:hypothetical protein